MLADATTFSMLMIALVAGKKMVRETLDEVGWYIGKGEKVWILRVGRSERGRRL